MKKLTKILTALGSVAAAASIVPLVATSCNKAVNGIQGLYTEVVFTGNDEATMYFLLDKELEEGQTLSISTTTENYYFDFTIQEPQKRIVPVTVSIDEYAGIEELQTWTGGLIFTCKKGDTVVWTQTVNNCSATYNQIVWVLDPQIVTELESPVGYVELAVTDYLSQTVEIEAKVTNYSTKTVHVNNVDWQSNSTVKVEVEFDDDDPDFGDTSSFALDLYGSDVNGNILWHVDSGLLTMTFNTNVIYVNSKDATIEGGVLKSINVTNGATALDLTRFTGVTKVADNFWSNSNNVNYIQMLRLNSTCNQFGVDAFKNAPIKLLDLRSMSDDMEWFAKGKFETDAFAFNNNSEEAAILYRDSWTDSQKHRINKALYSAGLTNIHFFNAIEVGDSTDPYNISEFVKLKYAVQYGANIKLVADIELPTKEELRAIEREDLAGEIVIGRACILDLNGHYIHANESIYKAKEAEDQTGVISVWNDAQLLVVDTSKTNKGAIKAYNDEYTTTTARNHESFAITAKSQNPVKWQPVVEIKNGNFYGSKAAIYNYAGEVYIGDDKSDVANQPNFHVNLHSAFYTAKTADKPAVSDPDYQLKLGARYMLNNNDASAAKGTFHVYGGRFWGLQYMGTELDEDKRISLFDPARSYADGTTAVSYLYHDEKYSYKTVWKDAVQPEEDDWKEIGYYEVLPEA